MIANYHSIETFSSVDGPGIRYVLFLQGCNMNCKYCHNVDTVSRDKNLSITVEEVVKDYLKYKVFYSKGGITVSGGEPLLQLNFIIELFTELKKHNVHTCIETQGSLFVDNIKFKKLLEVTDLFLVDLKGVDNKYSKDICGYDVDNSLKFLQYLSDNKKKFVITYVLLPTINDDDYCSFKLAEIMNNLDENYMSLQILPYHRLGVEKWDMLNLEYQLHHIKEPNYEDVNDFYRRIDLHSKTFKNKK